ncbi:hypothetical protein D3Y59_03200 [Hymenobacter oligotrophus]|uniref:Periplasmic heavy metal sensor n=1 Tax=Hymenobacter oligotrophus TaxID=2319843 RepID=A0A3B7QX83_9BACT|nr:hypothetical protein [Hymenobacter oligotrophus]AYA36155.1 hypothetical protein D3Y59_03200 [Hymenobacter oligotrophus]
MNIPKKSILLTAALLATAPAAWAQTAATKPKPADATAKTRGTAAPAAKPDEAKIEAQANGLTQSLKQALALSPQQEEKVRQINIRSVRQVEEARIRHRADLRKLNVIIEDIGQSRMAALKDVLTAAQFDKYQKAREKKMGVPSVQGNQGNAVPGLPPGRGEE